jgi:hypothetical protein
MAKAIIAPRRRRHAALLSLALPLLLARAVASGGAAPAVAAVCDVLVAGGSLASLAAAASAANVSSSLRVCFTDPTDWPGGQLTASAVPAVDFGPENTREANLPASFASFLFGPLMPGDTNLGNCWVSRKCFAPTLANAGLVEPLLAAFPNLRVFLLTAVTGATRDAATGRILSVSAVQRTPRPGTTGWEALTSQMLDDWYSATDSNAFTKTAVELTVAPGGVVIEGTEFSDVLATAGIAFAEGIEAPLESSTAFISTCGQGITIPFYMTYLRSPAPSPDPWPPGGGEGSGFELAYSYDMDWTYRRVEAAKDSPAYTAGPGETSVINMGGGNDFSYGYIFLPLGSSELNKQLAGPGTWRGGINLTTYARAEQRAYGFYHWVIANATAAARPYLALNASLAGTATGLAKMPYLRDARRSPGGLDGFRIFKNNLTQAGQRNSTAYRWPDTIGIGQYFYADIHKMSSSVCDYPTYIVSGAPVKPYYLPFRSLTVAGAPNLLVVGKSIASTFFANAAIRLHPEEWATGVAAGVAAGEMVSRGWASTQDALDNVAVIQATVAAMGSPLEWTLP